MNANNNVTCIYEHHALWFAFDILPCDRIYLLSCEMLMKFFGEFGAAKGKSVYITIYFSTKIYIINWNALHVRKTIIFHMSYITNTISHTHSRCQNVCVRLWHYRTKPILVFFLSFLLMLLLLLLLFNNNLWLWVQCVFFFCRMHIFYTKRLRRDKIKSTTSPISEHILKRIWLKSGSQLEQHI